MNFISHNYPSLKIFPLVIATFLSTNAIAQWPVQICNEPLDTADCVVNDTTPDYKTAFYNYMIIRDQYLTNVPKFGKNPLSNNPATKVDLKLDVYLPCNNETNRPMVIVPRASHYSFGNGVTSLGNGKHRYLLRELAKKGFVAVAMEYRSYTRITSPGFYVDITPGEGNALDSCAYNSYLTGHADGTDHFFRCYKCLIESGHNIEAEVIKKWMMYINVQDILAAVGYCAEDPAGIGFNVDTGNVFVGGLSNGGQIALTAAYLDDDEYTSNIENNIKNYLGPTASLGYAGILSPNFEFKGSFNFWGSIHDIDLIDDDDPPSYLVHGTWDDTVPYQDNFLGFQSNNEESHFYSYGSEAIACRLNEKGVNYGLFSMYRVGHGAFPIIDACTPGTICGVTWSDNLIKKLATFMRSLILTNTYATTIKNINPQNFGCNQALSQSLILELYESNLNGNCIQSPAHLPNNLSELLEYCNCEPVTVPGVNSVSDFSIFSKSSSYNELDIYPNPAREFVQFDLTQENDLIRIYDIYGKLVLEAIPKNNNSNRIDISRLNVGHYLVKTGNFHGKFIKL